MMHYRELPAAHYYSLMHDAQSQIKQFGVPLLKHMSKGIVNWSFLPPASAVEVIESEPCVCECVSVSVCEHSHGQTV